MRCHYCDREIGTARVCPYCHREIQKKTLPHQLPAGTLIDGRYRVEGVLGEGGFGITYLGYNQKLGLPVAIKEYFPQGTTYRDTSGSNEVYVGSEDAESFFNHGKERFLSEAKTLVRFNSEPGIVSVMDFVEENKTAYLIMEYLDGETLQQYLKRHGKMAATETFEMLEPMMRTLEKVHAAGVIHRDISPDNIMRLKNGHLKLMDFGAAREFVDENRSMSIMLKKGYAPAEQYRRKGEQGPWTDVYALCATIYRCITGVTPTDSLDRMSGEELKKPSELGADIPPAYEGLLMYGMALHQKDRCQNMTELLSLLDKTKKAVADQSTLQTKLEPATQITVAADPVIEKPKERKNEDPYVTVVAKEEPPIIKNNKNDKLQIKNSPSTEKNKPKKKKKGILIAVISISLAIILAVTGFLIWINRSEFEYKVIQNNTVEITGYKGNETKIEIPKEINGRQVTSIGESAFSECESLTSVTIPDSVTSIGDVAFFGCTSLKDVIIPNSVTSIGDGAFCACKSLTSVTLSDSITIIEGRTFKNCESLTSVTIPDSVTSIGTQAFDGCTGLTNITIPDSVTSIGAYAFSDTGWYNNQPNGLVYAGKVAYKMKGDCPAEVIIKDGTMGIADNAFLGCTGLTSITIPDSVTSICDYAFYGCKGLTSVTIPDAVTSICDSAFYGCKGLTSVTIPDSVTSIGGSAFSDCTGLTSITIPDSVTSIGDLAFSLCTGLTSVTIPDSVTSIGNGAFYGCNNLTIYGSKGSAAEKYANDNGIEFREI